MAIMDGAWRLVEWDAATQRSIWSMFDGEKTVFRVDQPADKILEANAEAEKETMGRRFGDWNRVASIPLQMYHNSGFAEAYAQGDLQWVGRFLNDSDNAKLRTSRGRV